MRLQKMSEQIHNLRVCSAVTEDVGRNTLLENFLSGYKRYRYKYATCKQPVRLQKLLERIHNLGVTRKHSERLQKMSERLRNM